MTAILLLGQFAGFRDRPWLGGYLYAHAPVPDWRQVVRASNLFDVLLVEHGALGSSPCAVIDRITHSGAPPLAVLGEVEETEKVHLLEAGAAYCLPPSIGWRELSARIDALAARRNGLRSQALMIGGWIVDLSGKRLVTPSLEIPTFTPIEFELLELFATAGERTLSRNFLLGRLGKLGEVVTERTIDVYVSRLRRRLQDMGADKVLQITAERGEGYVCVMDPRAVPFHRPIITVSATGEARA